MKTPLIAIVAAATFATAAGAVVVPNGDFSGGNSGFTSDYTYGPAQNQLSSGPPNSGAGYYSVVSDAQFSHSSFVSYGDHTTGTGLYLVANGALDGTTTVYRSSAITVAAGTTYSFGAFFANDYPANPATIDFRVALGGGTPTSIGTYTIADGAGVWNGASQSFNTGTATSVVLSFVDLNTQSNGNDFGIDDVTLTATVPEAATWAMMIAGFGLVGVVARRRSLAVA